MIAVQRLRSDGTLKAASRCRAGSEAANCTVSKDHREGEVSLTLVAVADEEQHVEAPVRKPLLAVLDDLDRCAKHLALDLLVKVEAEARLDM